MQLDFDEIEIADAPFTVGDVKDCLRGKFNREPTSDELLKVIDKIDDELLLHKMYEAGWAVIEQAKAEAFKEA